MAGASIGGFRCRNIPISKDADDLINTQSENGSFMAEERVKRKLAAILAADVVSYSRLGSRRGGHAFRFEMPPGSNLRPRSRRP
jgi:hypothetical protein